MKTYFLTVLFTLCCIALFNSCEKPGKEEAISACGVSDPAKNLLWLAELIEKAETDETGNYYGVIWLEQYNGQDVFVANMMLGSGGVMYHVFDCEGQHVAIAEEYQQIFFNNLKKNIVIYVHPDYPLNL